MSPTAGGKRGAGRGGHRLPATGASPAAGSGELADHDPPSSPAEELIPQLFSAGLILAGCGPMVDDVVAARLEAVTDLLDQVIAGLFAAALEAEARTRTRPPDQPEAVEGAETIVERIGDIAAAMRRLAADNANQTGAMQLGDAAHHLHRAWVTLRDELHQAAG